MSYLPGISPARSWRRLTRGDILLAAAALAVAALFLFRARELSGRHWDWNALTPYLWQRIAQVFLAGIGRIRDQKQFHKVVVLNVLIKFLC